MEPIQPLRSVGDLLKASWSRFTKNQELYIKLAAVFAVPAGISAFYSGLANSNAFLELAFTVVVIVVGVIVSAGFVHAVAEDGAGELSTYFEKGKASMGRYFLTKLLEGIVVLIGFILFIIPGIVLCIQLFASEWVALLENAKPTDALHQSRMYVKGRWWPVFLRVFLLGIMSVAVSLIVGLVFSVFGAMASGPANFVAILFIMPWAMCYAFELYTDVKATYRPEAVPVTVAA